jgi:hypothetical protein
MSIQLSPLPIQKFFDNNGFPLAFGKLNTYAAGTTTPIATYKDASGTLNTNPIILNLRGECALWIDSTKAYKFALTDFFGNTIPGWPVDNITIGGNLDNVAVDTGSANSIILTVPTIITLTTFTRVLFKAAATNTGATTLTVNGVSKSLTWQNLGAFAGGEIQQNGLYEAVYDGTRWQLLSPALQPPQMRTAAEVAAGVTPANYAYQPNDVRRYGADMTGVSDSGAAFNTAYLVATSLGNTVGGIIRVPAGQYKITTPVVFGSTTVGYFSLIGDGPSTKIINDVTGNPSNPCILVQAKSPFFTFADFDVFGNTNTGASGNGHGIAFINPDAVGTAGVSTFYPQSVTLRNVSVQGCLGTGKDKSGGSIPACGVYQYGVTNYTHESCTYYNNATGARVVRSEKIEFNKCTIDGNRVGVNGLYVDSCQNLTFAQGTLNGSGLGGTTDGCLFVVGALQVSNSIVLRDSRAKDGNPFVINLNGSANCNNHGVQIVGCDLRQLDNGDLTVISALPTNTALRIVGNYFLVLNTATVAVGVEVSGSGISAGLEISNNIFEGGGGSTYTNGILLNSSSSIRSPILKSNTFGNYVNNAQNFTNCIQINGNCDNPLIQGNTFKVSTAGSTLTNAINLSGGANVRWPVILCNSYDNAAGGTLTNQLNNGGALALMQIETGAATTVARRAVVTYSASMTADSALGNEFDITATNGTAFTINAPSHASDGQRITFTIRNASGGALGAVTWSGIFKMSAWTQPGNANSRSIDFRYDGTNWVQISQTGVDVPN